VATSLTRCRPNET